MNKLKPEDVMKALECCASGRPCRECEYKDKSKDTFGCRKGCLIDALALLREKDAEIERYRKIVGDLVIRDGEVVGIVDGKETRYIDKSVSNVLKTMAVNRVKADTVRKMHTEIKERCIKGGIYPAFVARTIENVAKEILEAHE